MGAVLADHRVFWFEEPFPPEDLDAYVALRPKLTVPLAAGENEFGVQGFPTLVIIDAQGTVRDVHVGYSPTLREDVGKVIRELLAAK